MQLMVYSISKTKPMRLLSWWRLFCRPLAIKSVTYSSYVDNCLLLKTVCWHWEVYWLLFCIVCIHCNQSKVYLIWFKDFKSNYVYSRVRNISCLFWNNYWHQISNISMLEMYRLVQYTFWTFVFQLYKLYFTGTD